MSFAQEFRKAFDSKRTPLSNDLPYMPFKNPHPISPTVSCGVVVISSFFAINSSTSQLDQMNLPFKNSASRLADQTMKEAASSAETR
jgi:hypothetical protein